MTQIFFGLPNKKFEQTKTTFGNCLKKISHVIKSNCRSNNYKKIGHYAKKFGHFLKNLVANLGRLKTLIAIFNHDSW
jgi:hypothetical protein